MKKIEKAKFWLLFLFRALLILALILATFEKIWIMILFTLLTLLLTFVPDMIKKKFEVEYPTVFELIILIFIFSSLYLGELKSFYEIFWWWDLMLHTLSGVIAGFIGFTLIYILHTETKIVFRLSPLFIAIFTFSFALSLGALWELFEFMMDNFFGYNMQKSGLMDTMTDLLVDALGAFVVSAIGYTYIKYDKQVVKNLSKILNSKN